MSLSHTWLATAQPSPTSLSLSRSLSCWQAHQSIHLSRPWQQLQFQFAVLKRHFDACGRSWRSARPKAKAKAEANAAQMYLYLKLPAVVVAVAVTVVAAVGLLSLSLSLALELG